MINSLFGILLTIGAGLIAPLQANEWKLKKESDGIQVFTRPSSVSDFDEFKGVGTIDAPLEKLLAVFKDADHMSDWSPNCEESKLMERTNDIQIHYTISGVPFPLQDRDAYTQFEYIPEPNGMKINITALPNFGPEDDDYVRIQFIKGYWLLEKESDHQTKVTYQLLADPGGSIPGWLANSGAVDTPINTIKAIRKHLNK
ncbi:START domain-containing protein [Marinoscillum pacificum]|uniref:START domain-containing protein n=1 Tax=Marinoscillum pacificum TaxID=392723 RepID=UPI0021583349|nr:START domain-containing protein [Marinoscillum pacificum]